MCQATIHHLWQRWSSEYLQQLQSLSKWRRASPNLQVGDVVVIRDDTPFICHWPVARIVKTFPGTDGLVRSTKDRVIPHQEAPHQGGSDQTQTDLHHPQKASRQSRSCSQRRPATSPVLYL